MDTAWAATGGSAPRQNHMYLPGCWLKPGTNEIVVLNLESTDKPVAAGLAKPILDQLRPEPGREANRRAGQTLKLAGLVPIVLPTRSVTYYIVSRRLADFPA